MKSSTYVRKTANIILSILVLQSCSAPSIDWKALETQARSDLYAGRYAQAQSGFEKAIQELDKKEPDSKLKPALQAQLAQALEKQKKFDNAERIYKDCLALSERKFGPDSEEVLAPLEGLRALSYEEKKFEEAENLARRILSIEEKTYSPNDPRLEFALSNIIAASCIYGKCKDDTVLLTRFLRLREKRYGGDSSPTCAARQLYAESLLHHRKYLDSAALFKRNIAAYKRTTPDLVPAALTDYAAAMYQAGEKTQAKAAIDQALTLERTDEKKFATNLIATLNALGKIESSENNYAAAEKHYAEMCTVAQATMGKDNPVVADYLIHYAEVLQKNGKLPQSQKVQAEAERLYHLKQGEQSH